MKGKFRKSTRQKKQRAGNNSRKRMRSASASTSSYKSANSSPIDNVKCQKEISSCENRIEILKETVVDLEKELKDEYEKRRRLISQMLEYEQEYRALPVKAYPVKKSPIYINDAEPTQETW